jgi:hypothetical protein
MGCYHCTFLPIKQNRHLSDEEQVVIAPEEYTPVKAKPEVKEGEAPASPKKSTLKPSVSRLHSVNVDQAIQTVGACLWGWLPSPSFACPP